MNMLARFTASIMVFSLFTGGAVVSASASPCGSNANFPSRVAVIGDSYTAGSAMGGRGDASWPSVVRNRLREQGASAEVTVRADPGSGYAKTGSKGTVFEDQIPEIVRPDDRLVVLFGSLNDGSIPADHLKSAVQLTLISVRVTAPAAELLVIGPAWPDAAPPSQVRRTRDTLAAQARAVQAVFVDPIADGWFFDRPDLIGNDGIHPTDNGHVYLAEKMVPLIARSLGCVVSAGKPG